jgi:hypothetical protein
MLVGLALTSVAVSACGATGSSVPPGAPTALASATAVPLPSQPERVELAGVDASTWRNALAPDGQTALIGQRVPRLVLIHSRD